jgi:hypothetical protein
MNSLTYRPIALLGAALLLANLVHAGESASTPKYVQDEKGCSVWSDSPDLFDHLTWDGKCEQGKASGLGTLIWYHGADAYLTYWGALSEGKMQGGGDLRTADGIHYEGQFANDAFEGQGILTLPNGERYAGNFAQGQRTGFGHYTWPNGNHYEGDFVDGLATGQGKKTWGNVSYEGLWQDGHMSGQGLYTRENGDQIKGQFLMDQLHDGPIEYLWKNGDHFQGLLVHGRANGHGIYTLASGERYEGQWANGTLNVQGREISID